MNVSMLHPKIVCQLNHCTHWTNSNHLAKRANKVAVVMLPMTSTFPATKSDYSFWLLTMIAVADLDLKSNWLNKKKSAQMIDSNKTKKIVNWRNKEKIELNTHEVYCDSLLFSFQYNKSRHVHANKQSREKRNHIHKFIKSEMRKHQVNQTHNFQKAKINQNEREKERAKKDGRRTKQNETK